MKLENNLVFLGVWGNGLESCRDGMRWVETSRLDCFVD